MPAQEPPATAAWRHLGARSGFEVLFVRSDGDGYRFSGHSTAVEEEQAWAVHYALTVDARWLTRAAHVVGWAATGERERRLEADGAGGWWIDGTPAPQLAGCVDVDLEASVFTNTLPARRLGLAVGEQAEAPAVYVRALDLGVQWLEQRYTRLPDDEPHLRYGYAAPQFDYRDVLVYDQFGFVLDYPGIAARVA
jgi:uncharacterized protein